jgi:two-component system NtrC family response regulator
MSVFNTINILVVDDEASIRKLFEKELQSAGRKITTAGNASEALALVRKMLFDVIVLDIRLPDVNGMELLVHFQETLPDVAVIMITGHGDIESAVEAMHMGAEDYLTKPFSLDRVEMVIEKAYQRVSLQRENRLLRHSASEHTGASQKFIGHSKATNHVRYLIGKVAPTDVPVLMTGESGTGKNVATVAIHAQSMRAGTPLITKSCATLDSKLLRSELFGYVKGAFTGAEKSQEGLLSLVNKGTLFFDEVGELSLELQGALLRLLETKRYRRVGEKEERVVDVRFIFATNRNLKKEVEAGRFHDAFYHRINVFHIELPPLRQRREDIPDLVEYALGLFSKDRHLRYTITAGAMHQLMEYDWPGNIRELKNVLERATILAENNLITSALLPLELNTCPYEPDTFDASVPLQSLADVEKNHVLKVLEQLHGNRTKAAQVLGISRKTLYRKIQEYGMEKEI